MILKLKNIIITSLILLIFILGLIFFDKIRSSFRALLPANTKVFVKELFFGKQFLDEVAYFRTANFNQKILPDSEFVKLKFEKIKLEDLDILDQTHYDKVNKNTSNVKSFYIDVSNKDLILATVKGKFLLLKDSNINKKIKIPNNLKKLNATHLMDIELIDKYIYASFRHEPPNSKCSYFFLVKAKFNEKFLNFEKFFNPDRCSVNNYGGRISAGNFKGKEGIILTTGATGEEERSFAQDPNSHLGKILFFSFEGGNYEIISQGHRNPQGLYVEDNLILATEHGPYGGDEINYIKGGGNYGWPTSSYGEKYKYFEKIHNKSDFGYKKSHKEYGFIEPIFTFVPSIGISEIIKIPNNFSKYWQNNFFITSLNGVSLYRAEFNEEYSKVKYIEKIIVLERVRDIKYLNSKNMFVLSLETTGQLGFLSIE